MGVSPNRELERCVCVGERCQHRIASSAVECTWWHPPLTKWKGREERRQVGMGGNQNVHLKSGWGAGTQSVLGTSAVIHKFYVECRCVEWLSTYYVCVCVGWWGPQPSRACSRPSSVSWLRWRELGLLEGVECLVESQSGWGKRERVFMVKMAAVERVGVVGGSGVLGGVPV